MNEYYDIQRIHHTFFLEEHGHSKFIGLKEPQGVKGAKIVDYANNILVTMYNYVIDTILSRNLPFSGNRERLIRDREYYLLAGRRTRNGIEAMSYFILKAAYDKDIRYTVEDLTNYRDFREYLPISNTVM